MDLSEIRSKKTAATMECSIQLDGQAAQVIENMREEMRAEERADLKLNRNPIAPGLRVKMAEAVEAAKETEATFTFVAIGRVAYDGLVTELPPTKTMLKEAEERKEPVPQWDVDKFPPALIALSCSDPEMTREEAVEIWEDPNWSGSELIKLFTTAMIINQESPDIPFDRLAIELTPITEPKSNGAPNEVSLEVSS